MPEISEVKIMTDFINEVVHDKIFTKIEKSPESKVKCDFDLDYNQFHIETESRGKEIKMTIMPNDFMLHRDDECLMLSMGMSGHWRFTKTGEELKHSHLKFYTNDGYTLSLVDVRRFAKWKWGDWNIKRGPDPVREYRAFVKNINDNIHKKIFDKPICELMLNQQYFNGIGNYLRAEILYRAGQNPFMSSRKAINDTILKLCKQIPEEAYTVGGGELKDWSNPYNAGYGRGRINKSMMKKKMHNFRDWLQCYQKMCCVVDGTKRKMWFDERWLSDEYINHETKKLHSIQD